MIIIINKKEQIEERKTKPQSTNSQAKAITYRTSTLTGQRGPLSQRYREELAVRCSPGRIDELYAKAMESEDYRLAWMITVWCGEMSHGKPKQAIETASKSPLSQMTPEQLAEIRKEVDSELKRNKPRIVEAEIVENEPE